MRRRTRPRVVWLPPSLANVVGQGEPSNFKVFIVNVPGPQLAGAFAVGESPLVIDDVNTANPAVNTLSDVENSGYRLRRIVGKIWVELEQAATAPGRVAVTAGLIVRRVDPTSGQSVVVALGTAGLVSPTQVENIPDPWIWRRSWLLSNNLGLIAGEPLGPERNDILLAGGVSDAMHVDQKTARIISQEERLFLDVGVVCISTGVADTNVRVTSDLRVLASMRTSSGNRRNASR